MSGTVKSFKLFTWFILFILFLAFPLAAHSKDKIRIGRSAPVSGPNAISLNSASGPMYDMWIEEVNAKGGIYVKEYGKKLPIELIQYDDKSDIGTMIRLLEKLIMQDKVDFIFSPVSTSHIFAAAPVANKHKYILFASEGGALKLNSMTKELPYFFSVLNFADTQMPVLAEIYKQNGIKSVATIYIDDLHGIEYQEVLTKELQKRGIAIKMKESFPMETKDLAPLLKRAKSLDVDAFVGITYPAQSILVTKQAIAFGINFRSVYIGVGSAFAFFPGIFGKAVEGILGPGAWNCKSSPETKLFCDKFTAKFGEKAPWDFWGHILYYSSCQILEQAIERAGTLDQEKIRDIMATEKFDTALGKTWYEDGHIAYSVHPGEIGQWQNGVFEVIGRKEKATADLVYPKPDWPEPKPEETNKK